MPGSVWGEYMRGVESLSLSLSLSAGGGLCQRDLKCIIIGLGGLRHLASGEPIDIDARDPALVTA